MVLAPGSRGRDNSSTGLSAIIPDPGCVLPPRLIPSMIVCCSCFNASVQCGFIGIPDAQRRSWRSRSSSIWNCSAASCRMLFMAVLYSAVKRSRSSALTGASRSWLSRLSLASLTMDARFSSILFLSLLFHSSSGSTSASSGIAGVTGVDGT